MCPEYRFATERTSGGEPSGWSRATHSDRSVRSRVCHIRTLAGHRVTSGRSHAAGGRPEARVERPASHTSGEGRAVASSRSPISRTPRSTIESVRRERAVSASVRSCRHLGSINRPNLAAPLFSSENAPPAELARKAPEPNSTQVTITGCLERADDTFRLKDTTGVEAPRSRSWKSGFLKKGSASIEIVDTASGLKLPDHVGQRVSVTGTLIDRAMQVRSLQRVAASCTNSARVRI
jgi:hypothetical protein